MIKTCESCRHFDPGPQQCSRNALTQKTARPSAKPDDTGCDSYQEKPTGSGKATSGGGDGGGNQLLTGGRLVGCLGPGAQFMGERVSTFRELVRALQCQPVNRECQPWLK